MSPKQHPQSETDDRSRCANHSQNEEIRDTIAPCPTFLREHHASNKSKSASPGDSLHDRLSEKPNDPQQHRTVQSNS